MDNSLEDKIKMKDQAKSLLLKGCYKMAGNKYNRLIDMGAQGFSQRQWAIIHLNTAISLHFQSRLDQALQRVNQSIKIDKTYEKAYYRRLQILQQQGNLELAIHDNIVPYFIQNKQIDQLKTHIAQQYQKQLTLLKLQTNLSNEDFRNKIGANKIENFIENSYLKIFQKIYKKEKVLTVEQQIQIGRHYLFLKNQGVLGGYALERFCYQLRKIFGENQQILLEGQKMEKNKNNKNNMENAENVENVENVEENREFMCEFWDYYGQYYVQKSNIADIVREDCVNNQNQRKLLQYYPCAIKSPQTFIKIINTITSQQLHPKGSTLINLSLCTKFLHTNNKHLTKKCPKNSSQYIHTNLQAIVLIFGQLICKQLNTLNFSGYQQKHLLITSILSILQNLSSFMPKFTTNHPNIQTYSQALLNRTNLLQYQSTQIFQILINYLNINREGLAHRYFVQELVEEMGLQFLVENGRKLGEVAIAQILIMNQECRMSDAKVIMGLCVRYSIYAKIIGLNAYRQKRKNKNSQAKQNIEDILIQQKINKINTKLLNIPQIYKVINHKNQKQQQQQQQIINKLFMIEQYVKCLSYLCLSQSTNIIQILNHTKYLKEIFISLFNKPKNVYYSIGRLATDVSNTINAIKLLYSCVICIRQQQQLQFAEKMGVKLEDINRARKLQGQTDQQQQHKIQIRQKQFIQTITNTPQWLQILQKIISSLKIYHSTNNNILNPIQYIKIATMLSSILQKLSQNNPKNCYHPIFIDFMLDIFTQNVQNVQKCKNIVSKYFINICKNCNPQIFKYVQLQAICNVLVYGIQNGKHQLEIFQGLLGLVQLSSQKVVVPWKMLIDLLMEENQYIVHAAFQVINNMLVLQTEYNGASDFIVKHCKKLIQFTLKYYTYFNGIVHGQEFQVDNLADYSHPCKIYCTIVSVLMIFDQLLPNFPISKEIEIMHKSITTTVRQLHDEKQAVHTLECLKGDYSMLLFKLILHHAQKNGKLSYKYTEKFSQQLNQLRATDIEKWQKLQKYLKQ